MTTPIFICVPSDKATYFRLERIRRRLRQQDVARLIGIPQSYVSVAERGLYVPWWAMERLEIFLLKGSSHEGDQDR